MHAGHGDDERGDEDGHEGGKEVVGNARYLQSCFDGKHQRMSCPEEPTGKDLMMM